MNNKIRLQKYIAGCTEYSRRKAEELIERGKVNVNGVTIKTQGITVDPEKDIVRLEGKKLSMKTEKIYLMLNKPAGYISSKASERGEKTIMDLLPHKNLYPVGRLDKDTEGLLLLTNDGEFSYEVTHPKFEHEKEYIAYLKNEISQADKAKLEKGVFIEGSKTAPCRILNIKKEKSLTMCNVIIHEGKKRQIRRMFEKTHNKVVYLKRIRIGKLLLGTLKKGAYKIITRQTAQKAIKK